MKLCCQLQFGHPIATHICWMSRMPLIFDTESLASEFIWREKNGMTKTYEWWKGKNENRDRKKTQMKEMGKRMREKLTEDVENHKFADALNLTGITHTSRQFISRQELVLETNIFSEMTSMTVLKYDRWRHNARRTPDAHFLPSNQFFSLALDSFHVWHGMAASRKGFSNLDMLCRNSYGKLLPQVQIFRWANID